MAKRLDCSKEKNMLSQYHHKWIDYLVKVCSDDVVSRDASMMEELSMLNCVLPAEEFVYTSLQWLSEVLEADVDELDVSEWLSQFAQWIEYLVEECDVDVNRKYGEDEYTWLHIVAIMGYRAAVLVDTLIGLGADPDIQDLEECTAIQLAIRTNHKSKDVVMKLCQVTDLGIPDIAGVTPLHRALMYDEDKEIIDELKAYGAPIYDSCADPA